MNPFSFFLGTFLISATGIASALLFVLFQKMGQRRIKELERHLQRLSEDVCQVAELQMKVYQKLSGNLGDIEERIVDLAVPSHDASHPLERRHHILTLARKGVAVEEIAQRLNVPRGEAELILNLRKYLDTMPSRSAQSSGETNHYGEA